MARAPTRRPGFDAGRAWALLVHGYAINRLTWAQCDRLATAVSALGAGLLAAPNGDLSETGTPSAADTGGTLAFSFVVGAVAASAVVKATQSAVARGARVDRGRCAAAERSFHEARGLIDALLEEAAGVSQPGEAGLYLFAAGPLATARLQGESGATLWRDDDAADALEVSWDADPDAARLSLQGRFVLTARYD